MNALLPGHVRSASSWLNVSACSLALLPVAALAGCSAVLDLLQPKEKPGPNAYPAAYRTELLDYLKNNPRAITTVREAYISAPSMKPFGSESRYFVCVKAGDDQEQVEKIAFLSAGKVIQLPMRASNVRPFFISPSPSSPQCLPRQRREIDACNVR
jgi:hypothetical protein